MSSVLTASATKHTASSPALAKGELKRSLSLAQSDRERELVRYTAFKASGLSATGARRHYGLENMTHRSSHIERCICEAESIRESTEELAQVQERAALKAVGLASSSSDSDSESECSESDQGDVDVSLNIPRGELMEILTHSCFNWFEVVAVATEHYGENVELHLEEHFTDMMASGRSEGEKKLLEQSHQAYLADKESRILADRQAESLNGMIVTDSE